MLIFHQDLGGIRDFRIKTEVKTIHDQSVSQYFAECGDQYIIHTERSRADSGK